MYEFFVKFNFFDEDKTKERKVAQGLDKLKINSYLQCFIFADKSTLSQILNDDQIQYQLEESDAENVERETKVVDSHTSQRVIASIGKFLYNEKREPKIYFKFFVFSTEETEMMLENFVQNLIAEQSKAFENIAKDDSIKYLNSLFLWNIGSEYENQLLEETLLHHFLLARNSHLSRCLVDFGCEPSMRRFIMRFDSDTVRYMASNGFVTQDVVQSQFLFHCISYSYSCKPKEFYKLEDIFTSIVSCVPREKLSRYFLLKSSENKNLNSIEYACRVQANKIFELILNVEGGLKSTDNATNYDVSNLIPDTITSQEDSSDDFVIATIQPTKLFLKSFQVSCLERIIASSEVNESRASKMLVVKPMTYLIDQYILFSKFIRCFMFLLQTLFMIAFTWYNMNSVSSNFSKLLNGICVANGSVDSSKMCTKEELYFPGLSSILWLFWPIFTFIFSTYQFVAMSKMLHSCDVKRPFIRTISEFPWIDLMILLSIFIWVFIVAFQKLPQSYFQLVAVIFIAGWLRSALFISFCSHWHGFVVSLQSSLSKYFISFIFVFVFIYIGFSFALKILLAEYASAEKSLYIVAFKTLAAVFGMGNLDEMPDEVEESAGKAVFIKAVIIAYCSLVAILVLAIIRQPDTELVVRVGTELFPRLKLRLLKDVVWLMRWRRSRRIKQVGEPEFGSVLYELHETFGLGGMILKNVDGCYVLRYFKEESEDMESTSENESGRADLILKELMKLKDDLEKLNKHFGC